MFDGQKTGAYTEGDATAPLSAYGRSKLAAERMLLDIDGLDVRILEGGPTMDAAQRVTNGEADFALGMGNAGQTNYAAAKAGVLGFTKSLAREVASRGITVNAVAPGFIDTDMTKELSEEQKEAIFSQVPANRLGKPEEIAAAVAFLASGPAAYITGETIHINGGMYMV